MILKHRLYFLVIGFWTFLLLGCGSPSQQLPPVVELKWQSKHSKQATHRVVRGDTLYSIAFRYEKDYRFLANYNHLVSPYTLRLGQIIYLQYWQKAPNRYYAPVENGLSARTAISERPQAQRNIRNSSRKRVNVSHARLYRSNTVHALATSKRSSPRFNQSNRWLWPVQGRVVTHFFPEQGKKGIDIAALKGKQIVAAAPGIVAYSGSGLTGYGNLIIIKHEGQFLTAYGNNLKNYVREGQHVKVGQVIAEIGMIGRKFWGVHFEIRKAGQPVNPMQYLP